MTNEAVIALLSTSAAIVGCADDDGCCGAGAGWRCVVGLSQHTQILRFSFYYCSLVLLRYAFIRFSTTPAGKWLLWLFFLNPTIFIHNLLALFVPLFGG